VEYSDCAGVIWPSAKYESYRQSQSLSIAAVTTLPPTQCTYVFSYAVIKIREQTAVLSAEKTAYRNDHRGLTTCYVQVCCLNVCSLTDHLSLAANDRPTRPDRDVEARYQSVSKWQ